MITTAEVRPVNVVRPRSVPPVFWATLVLLAAALILRAPRFGNPNLHVDETFYLYVADLMLNGSIPYVDVWDRKPVGLFILYAGIRLLGGDGILQYQLVATFFAFGTAFIITLMARRSCGWAGACLAGIAYVACLVPLGGSGGQSPVFYNLFMAGAAFLTLKAADTKDLKAVFKFGVAAMLLCGVAIQIKYPALVEGCFFGLMLLWLIWVQSRSLKLVVGCGAMFAACGILPTVAALGAYAFIGHLDAFWFANFTSISLRPPTSPSDILVRLIFIGLALFPLVALTLTANWNREGRLTSDATLRRFQHGWLLAAFLGFGIIGTFYHHYALPLLVPLAISAAPALDRRPLGPAFAAFIVIWAIAITAHVPGTRKSQEQISAMVHVVDNNLRGGCLFIFDGPPIVQYLTNACAPTAFAFPYHLSLDVERTGLGVDPEMEMRRLLARQPSVIISSDRHVMAPNLATGEILYNVLARDYHLAAVLPAGSRDYQVYTLK